MQEFQTSEGISYIRMFYVSHHDTSTQNRKDMKKKLEVSNIESASISIQRRWQNNEHKTSI